MTAARRSRWNYALQHAASHATRLGKPLVVLEALRSDYGWASDRLHTFVIEGMRDNATAFEDSPVRYVAYVEPSPGAGRGLLQALGKSACRVVADHYPAFFLPRMVRAAATRLDVSLEAVDSNGILPLSVPDRTFSTAHSFRRFLQKNLRPWLEEAPRPDPLRDLRIPPPGDLVDDIVEPWRPLMFASLADPAELVGSLPIAHTVPATDTKGGPAEAECRLRRFLRDRLARYAEDRNEPELGATSDLSPYLHFGHVSAHQVVAELLAREDWSASALSEDTRGSRSGWWGVSANAEAFLDQVITWRELGFNMADREPDHERYESLPEWARQTLAEHADDRREHVYQVSEFEAAETHDQLWNAAQRQLVRDGTVHNYLRMLWGKKILEWSETPRSALEVMIELNNKYALDGRDPNSCSGIFWCLGRYDRAWGPERPVFGKVRYMSSTNTARKHRVRQYIRRYSE
jgi:deoxyribodipyrimidine photo-lyase